MVELHLVTVVDNSTGTPVPEQCNTAPCLAVFGVTYKVGVHALGGQ
jgi:hypothetical protein